MIWIILSLLGVVCALICIAALTVLVRGSHRASACRVRLESPRKFQRRSRDIRVALLDTRRISPLRDRRGIAFGGLVLRGCMGTLTKNGDEF
jgi:hypothetical protein